jgi:uncharacterized Tic20 family protein
MTNTPSASEPQPALSVADDYQWGSLAHLGGILGILPALIIWLVFRERGAFTNTEGKEALNFQITVIIASAVLWIIAIVLSVILPLLAFLFATLPAVPWIASLVFSVLGFLQAKDGTNYRYPVNLRLIK